jgi:hypothetical protein
MTTAPACSDTRASRTGPVTAEDIAALIAGQLGHVEHQAVEAAEDD